MVTPCSQPIKENINLKLLNIESNIKANILWALLSSYLVKKERKESMTIVISFLIFFAKFSNLEIKLESSSSIKALNEGDGSFLP